MGLRLDGKVLLVTGASVGIGAATVRTLAAKTALLSVNKTLAVEFGPGGVRSNVVAPGPTRTRLWDAPGGFAE